MWVLRREPSNFEAKFLRVAVDFFPQLPCASSRVGNGWSRLLAHSDTPGSSEPTVRVVSVIGVDVMTGMRGGIATLC